MTYKKLVSLRSRVSRTFTILFCVVVLASVLAGCGVKTITKTELVVDTQTQDVYIPVKCEIPEISCEFKGEGFVPTEKLLDCVIKQKRAIEICTK